MALDTGYLLPGASRLSKTDGFFETYKGVIETETGKVSAYVKLLGKTTLANEIVSILLGQGAGLAIPKGYLVRVSAADYPDSEFLKGQRQKETVAFGSTCANALSFARQFQIKDDEEEAQVYKELFPKWGAWQDAVIFDDWIGNSDRHVGNLLIGASNDVWLIDHSHAFMGPNWQRYLLKPDAYTTNRVAVHVERFIARKEKEAFGRYIHKLAEKFKELNIADIVENDVVISLLGQEDVQALKRFVTERIENLPVTLSKHVTFGSMQLVPATS